MADDDNEESKSEFEKASPADKNFSLAGGIFSGLGAYALGAGVVLSSITGLAGTAAVFYGIKAWFSPKREQKK